MKTSIMHVNGGPMGMEKELIYEKKQTLKFKDLQASQAE